MSVDNLDTKGDYINYCLAHCDEITDIDTAIPVEVYRACKEIGVSTTYLVTIYYETGEVCYENIVVKACMTQRWIQLQKDQYEKAN